jgi:hypothetical protein
MSEAAKPQPKPQAAPSGPRGTLVEARLAKKAKK